MDKLHQAIAASVGELQDSRGLLERAHYLGSRLDAQRRLLQRLESLTNMERRQLRDTLSGLRGDLGQVMSIAKYAADTGSVAVACPANPWAPFGGAEEVAEGRAKTGEVFVEAFHGEVESAAVNVFNLGGTPRTFRVMVNALKTPGTDSPGPAAEAITLREVVSIPTQMSDYAADALPELNQGNTISVPAWGSRQVWVTVDTSKLEPGAWSTQVRFKSLEVTPHEAAADLNITVWDVDLPKERALNLCHWSTTDQPEGTLEDQVAHGTSVFARAVSGSGTFDESGAIIKTDFAAHDAYVKRHAPHGILLFHSLAKLTGPAEPFSDTWRKAYAAYIALWLKHLEGMGVGYEDFAFYPVDEPGLEHGQRVDIWVKWAELAHEIDPKIRMYANPAPEITAEQVRRMLPFADIWVPLHIGTFPEELTALIHETGVTYWTYTCSHNAKHQSPLGYYRGQAWMCWEHGHTGLGFWTYYSARPDPWFAPEAGADYSMIYQGKGVVTSKRWEAVRDGIEDYTMLHALREAAHAAQNDPAKAALVTQAKRICDEEAKVIAGFCNGDSDGTVPGKDGLPGVRRLADKRWAQIQRVRRDMAETYLALTQK